MTHEARKKKKDLMSSQRFLMSLVALRKAIGKKRLNLYYVKSFWSFEDVFFFEISGSKTCIGLGKRLGGELDILFVSYSLKAIITDVDPDNKQGKKIKPHAIISITKNDAGYMKIVIRPEGQTAIDVTNMAAVTMKTLAQVLSEAQVAVRKANIANKAKGRPKQKKKRVKTKKAQ